MNVGAGLLEVNENKELYTNGSSGGTKDDKKLQTPIHRIPEVEEEEGSVLDFPEEYVRAVPSRRPDIFPDLKEQKTPMPKKMPGDPEAPDEESEEKERKENPGEPGEKPEDEEEEEKEKKKKKKEKEEEE